MRQLSAFLRKEGMEFIRTGKIWILLIIFILFGIMNPAIAKLTPWMVETMSDSLAESGMVLTEVKVNAMTSWNQFYEKYIHGADHLCSDAQRDPDNGIPEGHLGKYADQRPGQVEGSGGKSHRVYRSVDSLLLAVLWHHIRI